MNFFEKIKQLFSKIFTPNKNQTLPEGKTTIPQKDGNTVRFNLNSDPHNSFALSQSTPDMIAEKTYTECKKLGQEEIRINNQINRVMNFSLAAPLLDASGIALPKDEEGIAHSHSLDTMIQLGSALDFSSRMVSFITPMIYDFVKSNPNCSIEDLVNSLTPIILAQEKENNPVLASLKGKINSYKELSEQNPEHFQKFYKNDFDSLCRQYKENSNLTFLYYDFLESIGLRDPKNTEVSIPDISSLIGNIISTAREIIPLDLELTEVSAQKFGAQIALIDSVGDVPLPDSLAENKGDPSSEEYKRYPKYASTADYKESLSGKHYEYVDVFAKMGITDPKLLQCFENIFMYIKEHGVYPTTPGFDSEIQALIENESKSYSTTAWGYEKACRALGPYLRTALEVLQALGGEKITKFIAWDNIDKLYELLNSSRKKLLEGTEKLTDGKTPRNGGEGPTDIAPQDK